MRSPLPGRRDLNPDGDAKPFARFLRDRVYIEIIDLFDPLSRFLRGESAPFSFSLQRAFKGEKKQTKAKSN
jgi:hypothetical protein